MRTDSVCFLSLPGMSKLRLANLVMIFFYFESDILNGLHWCFWISLPFIALLSCTTHTQTHLVETLFRIPLSLNCCLSQSTQTQHVCFMNNHVTWFRSDKFSALWCDSSCFHLVTMHFICELDYSGENIWMTHWQDVLTSLTIRLRTHLDTNYPTYMHTFPRCCLRGFFCWAGVWQQGFLMGNYIHFKRNTWIHGNQKVMVSITLNSDQSDGQLFIWLTSRLTGVMLRTKGSSMF